MLIQMFQQWLNKPDGNRGWASYFLEKGYEVFIVDIWGTGRSNPSSLPPLFSTFSVELVELAFTAPEVYKKYYQAKLHTQWPGVGDSSSQQRSSLLCWW